MINDARINDESASDGTVWLNIQCPEQSCGHSFVKNMDEAIDDLAQYALDGFAVEHVYEGDPGADFYGQRQRQKPLRNETGISAKPLAIWKKKASISNSC